MKNTDKAILLNRISYSESSLILTFYTHQNGLQKFIFQGGKKKAHQLFPLAISEITFYKRPDSNLGKLTASESQRMLNELPFDPIKSTIAFFVADVLLKCLRTEEPESSLFEFLEDKICELDLAKEVTYFPIIFLLDFAHYLGIFPHKSEGNFLYFNIMEGVFENVKPINDIFYEGDAVELISMIMDNRGIELGDKTAKKTRDEALQILIHYYQLHIPQFTNLKSLEVIREILYS